MLKYVIVKMLTVLGVNSIKKQNIINCRIKNLNECEEGYLLEFIYIYLVHTIWCLDIWNGVHLGYLCSITCHQHRLFQEPTLKQEMQTKRKIDEFGTD